MRSKSGAYKIAAIAVVLMFIFFFIVGGDVGGKAHAAFADTSNDVVTAYERQNILKDLQGATIGGEPFNIEDYPHDSKGKLQIISFVEFCYSYNAEKQADYGLYVYVYNPQDTAIDTDTDRNKIELKYGAKSDYDKPTLQFLNYSTEAGYEGRFWKFKISLTDEQRASILKELSENERIYEIIGIELSIKNEVADYPCLQTYTYSGYAKGYGSELAETDTLSCEVDGVEKYLRLDVHNTFFRGKGTNGKKYIQDTLHSVYFSVPNEYIEEYGKMTAVHATWLDAHTAPALVTGNRTHYEAMLNHIGEEIGVPETYADLRFKYSFRTEEDLSDTSIGGVHFSGYYYGYNYPSKLSSKIVNNVTNLQWIFEAENGNAAEYVVPRTDILDYMRRYTSQHGGELVNGKYSKALFDNVDDAFTEINIRADKEYSLTSEIIKSEWWEKLFGSSHVEEVEDFKNIKAIEPIDYNDLKNLERVQLCDKYYIYTEDYEEFKEFCAVAKQKEETVYLFRYKQTEYLSAKVYEGTWKKTWVANTGGVGISPGYVYSYENDDTNAFIMQQWVQLDFDIIDLTLTKDDVKTVIGCVMSPMDIAAAGTPPVNVPEDFDFWQWLADLLGIDVVTAKIIFWVVVVVIALAITLPILSAIFPVVGQVLKVIIKGVGAGIKYLAIGLLWLITSPFRLIAWIVRKIKERKSKPAENKAKSKPKTVKKPRKKRKRKGGKK